MSEENILDRIKDEKYRNSLVNMLSKGISDEYVPSFKDLLNYVIDKKLDMFNKPEFMEPFYKDDDKIIDLVLPAIRRVFGQVFVKPPEIFNPKFAGVIQKARYRLFILYFDIDYFIDYLQDMALKSKDILAHLEYIDGTVQTLSLIVDNYIGYNIKRVNECNDIESVVKIIKRNNILKNILNDELGNFNNE